MKKLIILAALITANTAHAGWFSDFLTTIQQNPELTRQAVSLGKSTLSEQDIAKGLKEALTVGSQRVAKNLGKVDGFNKDALIHIPLPSQLQKAKDVMTMFGMGSIADDVELKLNRAAEASMPVVQNTMVEAIKSMTIEDAVGILNGGQDSATQFFKNKTTPQLVQKITPIVDKKLMEVGALSAYDKMMGDYKKLPLVPDMRANLTNYAVEKALSGMFTYLGKEEAAIRQNPAKRTTELLQKVFSK